MSNHRITEFKPFVTSKDFAPSRLLSHNRVAGQHGVTLPDLASQPWRIGRNTA